MSGIIDYVKWRGDIPFDFSPLNDNDIAIMCVLSYMPFGSIIPVSHKETLPLGTACERVLPLLDKKSNNYLLAEELSKSPRFRDIPVCGYENTQTDSMHFCALTFIPEKKKSVIVFMGTDDTIVGWRETLSLSYFESVPSQIQAVEYLKKAALIHKGILIPAGHSKGGNLAVYAAAHLPDKIKSRISSIFNLDGPGFNKQIIGSEKLRSISSRVKTIVPQDSIIGMLLTHPEKDSLVIESVGRNGFEQHDLFTWKTAPKGLFKAEGKGSADSFENENIRDWIDRLTYEEKKNFIDILFELIKKDEKVANINIADALLAYSRLSPDKRTSFNDVISALGKTLKDNIIERIKEKQDFF